MFLNMIHVLDNVFQGGRGDKEYGLYTCKNVDNFIVNNP